MTRRGDAGTAQAWAALGGGPPATVEFDPVRSPLAARLPVRELARATVGACSLAAADLLAHRNGTPPPPVRVHEGAVATAFVSERHLRIAGRAPVWFAPLSRFWRTADGWVRTHANYPHHRARLLGAAGVPDPGDDDALVTRVAEVFATRPAAAIEEDVSAAGGLAVAVRGVSAERHPLVETRSVGGGERGLPPAATPASGVRVLDLTRVFAGPVATRTLALLGADVLRLDPPGLPEDGDTLSDTGLGKRSAVLDLAVDRDVFEGLLSTADVVVTGYRPGALDRFGLAPDALLERRPGLVVAQLCAWGWTGPRAGRRGFDSLVQAGSGIAVVEGDDDRPGALPAQALDHGTGYLLAAAVLRGLAERAETGGRHVRLSLAGTASWLLHDLRQSDVDDSLSVPAQYDPAPFVTELDSPSGALRHARSPIGYDGVPTAWSPPSRWGADRAEWLR
ncbi:CoA transferase [Actinosynnema sp. NPDC047251]|uniref:L-carnitine dehydratase/bile acid-inducible protein F n=1 Tax=Saccharothrix espanaensis (strain ATCC 51144 / DSM 44229 / JCM 9112 / NBRC 15066 / NRRL 15764) TaxID=1179773 RepID=K0JT45_SACES|nr:CoA transferase [Saccharothrix espanaensis]CCH30945.1 L-carnitine dehydratase/bile acid-inducible protein F [Saccharothrix espanaensis DSM 44229]